MLLLALTDQFEDEVADAVTAGAARCCPAPAATSTSGPTTRASSASGGPRPSSSKGGPGSGYVAYELLREAMGWYEKAEALRPAGNDDALLRWNTCVRHPRAPSGSRPRPRRELRAVARVTPGERRGLRP